MRWIRYSDQAGTHYGILEGERVRRVAGSPFDGYTLTDEWTGFEQVRLEVPIMPRTFYCAGLNYSEHAIEAARKRGQEPQLPKQADIGYRANNALVPHGHDVVIPADAKTIHYEGELVVVIGKQARNLAPADVPGCILGYTIGNDVSERNWQRSDRTFWRAKNADTFKPMGPWIDTDFDPSAARTYVRVNGETTTAFPTAAMIFDISTFLCAMTRYLTLYPGDVVWMGTDGQSPDLEPGDTVEIEITGLGTLRNTFVQGEPHV